MDDVLKTCVRKAGKLSAMCSENEYARAEKRKIAFRALSHLCRNNYSCDDVFDVLYSQKNPDSRQKALDFKIMYKKAIVVRQQYIYALDEIINLRENLNKLFEGLEQLAEYPAYSNSSTGTTRLMQILYFLHKTDDLKGKIPAGKLCYRDLGLYIRNRYMAELDKSLDDGAIVAYWFSGRYELLSNSNLKTLGDLICDLYKEAYASEIAEHRKGKKNEYNRKRHTPKKKLSAQEKRRRINELKSSGLTQAETASALGVSKSTVERNWNT
jgi:DNA-binding CsgD family transcriptional regulator